MRYNNCNNVFDSPLIILKKEISQENNINKLMMLSSKEKKQLDRLGFHKLIRRRINIINYEAEINKYKERFQQQGFLINLEVLDRIVNKVPWYDEEYNNREYVDDETKNKVYIRDNNRCQLCGTERIKLLVHHIIPNYTADMDNLILLCKKCHTTVHSLLAKKGYRYYAIGQRF